MRKVHDLCRLKAGKYRSSQMPKPESFSTFCVTDVLRIAGSLSDKMRLNVWRIIPGISVGLEFHVSIYLHGFIAAVQRFGIPRNPPGVYFMKLSWMVTSFFISAKTFSPALRSVSYLPAHNSALSTQYTIHKAEFKQHIRVKVIWRNAVLWFLSYKKYRAI